MNIEKSGFRVTEEQKEFMSFVKKTIESKRYPIYSTKPNARSASLSFNDEKYGCVLVNFYCVAGFYYCYKATSSNNSNLILLPSTSYKTATGTYTVICRNTENNFQEYSINIGKIPRKHKK